MNYQDFKKPNKKFAPSPFWAINDKLNTEETKRQMKDLIDHGFGGGFFHARHGLITEYMSKEWFDNVHAALDTAKENDGYLWLYDEDLWPSGNAGGRVAGMKDEYRASTIRFEFVPIGDKPNITDAPFKCAYRLKGRKGTSTNFSWDGSLLSDSTKNIDSFEIISLEEATEDTNCERIIVRQYYSPKIGWWSGESYANLLNPEAMDEFIKQTHEKYKAEIGEDFGNRVPGIFTDEPQLATGFNAIAWWEGLPAKYEADHHRNFWEDLPYMIFDHEKAMEARLLINRTIIDQFTKAFGEKLYNWCEENKLALTGHYNGEDFFRSQIANHYSGVMAHYKYMQIPGIDHLCRQANGVEDNVPYGTLDTLVTVKQVASAAHQYDRNQVLVEIYGVSRHVTTLAEFKWMGEANMVLGATFFVPHLTWYSMRGRRKRDYPPVFNYQQTYWDDINKITTFFNSVSNVLTSAKPKVDICILHTIESAIATRKLGFVPNTPLGTQEEVKENPCYHANVPLDINKDNYEFVEVLDKNFRDTVRAVCDMGYDCDLGDENYIEEIGSAQGDTFKIGAMTYKIMIVPEAITFRPSTVKKLYDFAKAGGKVILLGKVAGLVDGKSEDFSMKTLLDLPNVINAPQSKVQLQHALGKVYNADYSLTDMSSGKPVEKTLVARKYDDKGEIFYIVNSEKDYEKFYQLRLKGYKGKNIYILDATEHKIYEGKAQTIGEDLVLPFLLGKYDSLLIYVTEEVYGDTDTYAAPMWFLPSNAAEGPDTFDYELNDDNIAVADNVSYSVDNGKTWVENSQACFARQEIAKFFKTERALEWQNWVCDHKGIFDGLGGPVKIKYFIESEIETEARVAFESLNGGSVTLNGETLDFNNGVWKYDRTFATAPVKIKKGTNVFEHSFDFNHKSDIENIYIYGNFGVKILNKTMGCITTLPEKMKLGSWVEQGLPFYIGSVKYKWTCDIESDKAMIKVNNPVCTLYKVYVNDKKVKDVWLTPNLTDISEYIKQGENKIEIELVSSLQNAFGPLHDKKGDDNFWVHVQAFEDPQFTRDQDALYDYGILGDIEMLTK